MITAVVQIPEPLVLDDEGSREVKRVFSVSGPANQQDAMTAPNIPPFGSQYDDVTMAFAVLKSVRMVGKYLWEVVVTYQFQ